MASNLNITMKHYNGTDYDTMYPKTNIQQINGLATIINGISSGNIANLILEMAERDKAYNWADGVLINPFNNINEFQSVSDGMNVNNGLSITTTSDLSLGTTSSRYIITQSERKQVETLNVVGAVQLNTLSFEYWSGGVDLTFYIYEDGVEKYASNTLTLPYVGTSAKRKSVTFTNAKLYSPHKYTIYAGITSTSRDANLQYQRNSDVGGITFTKLNILSGNAITKPIGFSATGMKTYIRWMNSEPTVSYSVNDGEFVNIPISSYIESKTFDGENCNLSISDVIFPSNSQSGNIRIKIELNSNNIKVRDFCAAITV